MALLKIQIVRFADPHQPGWVECRLIDAWDRVWTFVEKVPVVAGEWLDETSDYPHEGLIACEIVEAWEDEDGCSLVTVDTSRLWGVAAIGGNTKFDVLASQVTGV